MPRYVRDEIITYGLEMANSPTVLAHDMPGGLVDPNAYSIKWLQTAEDMFHRKYPFSSDITEVAMTALTNSDDLVVASTPSLFMPPDFIIDVKNGLTGTSANGTSLFYLERKSYQYFRHEKLSIANKLARQPHSYAVVNNRIKVAPKVENDLALTLEYYALPPLLGPDDYPHFPDEWTLIEFIRLRALEWTRHVEPGVAQLYMQKQLAGLRSSGLLHEAEFDDGIPLDRSAQPLRWDRNAWMGQPHG